MHCIMYNILFYIHCSNSVVRVFEVLCNFTLKSSTELLGEHNASQVRGAFGIKVS